MVPPTFFARRDYPSSGGSVAVGDINGDGVPDLVAVAPPTISAMLGNGNGTFRAATSLGIGPFVSSGQAFG